jgi:hypothetical protein
MARASPMMFDVSCFGSCSIAYRVNEAHDWRMVSRGTICLPLGACVALSKDMVEATTFRFGRSRFLEASCELESASNDLGSMAAFRDAVNDLKKRTGFGTWVADPNSAFKVVPVSFVLAAHGDPGKVLECAIIERLLTTIEPFDVRLCDPSYTGLWRGASNALNDFRLVGSPDGMRQLLTHFLGDDHSPVKMFKRSKSGEHVIHCEAKSSEMNTKGCLAFKRIHPDRFALMFLASRFQSSIALHVAVEGDLKLVNGGGAEVLHLSNNTGYGTTFEVNGDPEKSARSEQILRNKLTAGKAVHLSDISY